MLLRRDLIICYSSQRMRRNVCTQLRGKADQCDQEIVMEGDDNLKYSPLAVFGMNIQSSNHCYVNVQCHIICILCGPFKYYKHNVEGPETCFNIF